MKFTYAIKIAIHSTCTCLPLLFADINFAYESKWRNWHKFLVTKLSSYTVDTAVITTDNDYSSYHSNMVPTHLSGSRTRIASMHVHVQVQGHNYMYMCILFRIYKQRFISSIQCNAMNLLAASTHCAHALILHLDLHIHVRTCSYRA